jgi:hypothetical protein
MQRRKIAMPALQELLITKKMKMSVISVVRYARLDANKYVS